MKALVMICRWLLITGAITPITDGATLNVAIAHAFGNVPLRYGDTIFTNTAGNTLSVTRLDYLLSGFVLMSPDGRNAELTNQFAYISAAAQRDHFSLTNIPARHFVRLRFRVGVTAEVNHADPALIAPDHPLNPNLNGLHWNWQGGYVFLALEGNWLKDSGLPGGYSYHLATDRMLMNVEVPVALDLSADCDLALTLDVRKIFSKENQIRITGDSTSTHSRPGHELANELRQNVEGSFSVTGVRAAQRTEIRPAGIKKVEMAATAIPYRLTIPSFFPRPSLPLDNPLTEQGVELGRRLFQDTALSINNSQSCASCHRAEAAFADYRRYSLGAEGHSGKRNAMALFNLAWKNTFFWDGRAPSLRDQVLRPIQDSDEMHETLTNVIRKLDSSATNRILFARAFGTPDITADRIARALEQFLLTLVSHHSKFDRSLAGKAELTDDEKRGFELFHTEYDPRRGQFGADCFHCHGGPLFQSQTFANNGLDGECKDEGRSRVTRKSEDRGKFAVPSLRNVALTAPYMHDGRFATLEGVVAHYSEGIHHSPTLDPNIAKHPEGGLHLSAEDQHALVAFLKTLTDE